MAPTIVMTDPEHFEVSYVINPWMRPDAWGSDPEKNRRAARRAWSELAGALFAAGASVEVIPGEKGLPDMLFPANAAIVLDRKALCSRFMCPERRPEEDHFFAAFVELMQRGHLDEVIQIPERGGIYQEGAGDCIWDPVREHFWAGYGQRSSREAIPLIESYFEQRVVALELVSPRFYHLDVCFYPLSGGEVVFYPGAFAPASEAVIRSAVPADKLIEATEEEASLLCLNAVNIGQAVVMARGTQRLRSALIERGYTPVELDLSPFIMSGGAAFCMTLRLDRKSALSAVPLQEGAEASTD